MAVSIGLAAVTLTGTASLPIVYALALAGGVTLVLDAPAPGTALIAAEGSENCGVSVWSYLYGDDAATIVERDKPRWQQWLNDHSGAVS